MEVELVKHLPDRIKPYPHQMAFYYDMLVKKKKRAFLVWSRQVGKDVSTYNVLGMLAMMKRQNYYYVFPEKSQGKDIIWEGIDGGGHRFLTHIPEDLYSKKPNNRDLILPLINGANLYIFGAKDVDRVRGRTAGGWIVSEHAFQSPKLYKTILPTLRATDGFIIFNTTPNGYNHAYDLWNSVKDDPDWHTSYVTATDALDHDGNRLLTDEFIKDCIKIMGREAVLQEYFCDWSISTANAYFGYQMDQAEADNRIVDFPIDTDEPVHTFWDLGQRDCTSICFVQVKRDGSVKFIHHYEDNNRSYQEHVNYLHQYQAEAGIVYGTHFVPHDSKNRESDNISRLVKLKKMLGEKVVRVDRPKTKIEHINLTRAYFRRYTIHKTNCKYFIECLKDYHPKVSKSGVTTGPDHNWAADAADCFMLVAKVLEDKKLNRATKSQAFMNPACTDYQFS